MYPGIDAANGPDHPAVVMAGSGESVSYAELDERSNRFAQLLFEQGLRAGDHIAFFLENHPRIFEIVWAALRSGLYYTPINSHLTAPEVDYIASDCEARVFVTSTALASVAQDLELPRAERRLMVRSFDDHRSAGVVAGFDPFEDVLAKHPAKPLEREIEGSPMMYSSGTTGRPKGILPPLPSFPPEGPNPMTQSAGGGMWRFGGDTRYLSPAPLYHAAPIVTSTLVQRLGGTVVQLERFDATALLAAIEKHQITHAQLVPTMFVRLLKLPPEVRERYDLSSLEVAVHAAAPCPVEIKQAMMDWWGPIISEYYAGSENIGSTIIGPEEWLAHPGSVGPCLQGTLHILDEQGRELPPGEDGQIWFENEMAGFSYHNDPVKTAEIRNERGWWTLGDIGTLDADGYLYLTDRVAHMIISGGVNIYPQEVEDLILTHPRVLDAAVIGVPDEEMGEQVKAVVQPIDMGDAGPELERELIDFCRDRLAHFKCPKSVDFDAALPRQDTGKLYKRLIKDRYWGKKKSRIV
ncbi:MAG: acyl-CoA synthetase [Myxococcales bacterium]|nr:acyl-CoA synthetase [Myxococcales bacterium]